MSLRWTSRAALRPVPPYAVVPAHAVEGAERAFVDSDALTEQVEAAFEALDREQPALARYFTRTLDALRDDVALALGHFASVVVHAAFRRAFGDRVREVDEAALEVARGSLEVDEELRRGDGVDALESDDVIALAQPHLLTFVREQLDAALEADEDGTPADVDLDAVLVVYRMLLVAVLALSHAVVPAAGAKLPRTMLA